MRAIWHQLGPKIITNRQKMKGSISSKTTKNQNFPRWIPNRGPEYDLRLLSAGPNSRRVSRWLAGVKIVYGRQMGQVSCSRCQNAFAVSKWFTGVKWGRCLAAGVKWFTGVKVVLLINNFFKSFPYQKSHSKLEVPKITQSIFATFKYLIKETSKY